MLSSSDRLCQTCGKVSEVVHMQSLKLYKKHSKAELLALMDALERDREPGTGIRVQRSEAKS